MLDALQDWLAGIALAITTALGGFLAHLMRGQQKHAERMVILEHQAAQVPELLGEIRDEVRGMREDGRTRQREMYEHMDKMRLEIKDDLKGKVDK